jgi:hypothetical protein
MTGPTDLSLKTTCFGSGSSSEEYLPVKPVHKILDVLKTSHGMLFTGYKVVDKTISLLSLGK